jgi:ABC-type phosphate transport system substrate-binding protein
MKTTTKTINGWRKNQLFLKRRISGKQLLIIIVMMCCFSFQAQKAKQTITISGAQFTASLVEKWTSEYSKMNPEVTFSFMKSSKLAKSADLTFTVNSLEKREGGESENLVNVARLAVLPIANKKNTLVSKQLINGIKQDELKNIFLQSDYDLPGDDEEPKGEPLFTVYTQSPQSSTAKVLINHFGQPTSELNGVIVTGDDKYLVESVLEDSTGITYGNLGLIYDLNNRTPLTGIKILPIDPDDNGRLKKDELVYENLDQLIRFLESSKSKTIPIDNISFSYDKNNSNPIIADFVSWVTSSGQQFNHQFGFLRTIVEKDRELTQK